VALVALLMQAGRRQRTGTAPARWAVPAGLALAALAIVALPRLARATSQAEASLLDAKPFSEQLLAAAQKGGKPVFVYFTADWCLSCKVNEGVAIERDATRGAFAKAGVTVLKGDWTRRDPAITRFLTAQGVAGVPLYLWYPGGVAAPAQLPQVLTPDTLPALAAKG
jgi:thiol:disulfide interchange protein